MSFEIIFHRLAFRELQRAAARYRGQSTRVADRFIVALDRAFQKIAENPLQWALYRPGLRWLSVHKFPYIVYFQIRNEDCVRIIAVAHGKRRPGYWLKRIFKP
jgi:plasmid stabilization system protein ParE